MNALDLNREAWGRIAAQKDRLAHAILLSGPFGILKTELAYAFAGSLLCESPLGNGEPCSACPPCNWFSLGNHPDFRWLKPDSMEGDSADEGEKKEAAKEKLSREITIDQVRGLVDFLNVGTHRSGYRVVLITPAEAMNRNTANALLKSLEEPRPGTLFILVTHNPDQLLPTIRSRCQSFEMQTPARAEALLWLEAQGVGEADRWLDRAGGAPRVAANIAKGSQGKLLRALEKPLGAGPALDALALAAEVDRLIRAERDVGAVDVIDWTQRWILDLLMVRSVLRPRYFPDQQAVLSSIGNRTTAAQLLSFGREAIEFKKLSQHTLNNRLFFEDFFSTYLRIFSTGAA